jgi:hypothetical protein
MTTTPAFKWTQIDQLKRSKSKYTFPKYSLLFSESLAQRYEPVVYSHECLSGPPEAAYYRILAKETTKELCIQYFFFWRYQNCYMISHRYDYEPIFVFVKDNETKPYLIVNGGLGGANCGFHKNEVRPKSGKRDWLEIHLKVKLSPKEYYPFGKNGNVIYKGCSKKYPLNSGKDLQFKGLHPLFGIRACSNVFSGAGYDLQGRIFNPPLKRLTDRILTQWYFKHYNHEDDMPFGHDIADPFTYPYIKYHSAKSDLPKPR